MNIDDYILISRNGTVYKAKISALSSLLFFKETKNEVLEQCSTLSSYIEDSIDEFKDTHYTSNEIKSAFSTKTSINELTSNDKYVLTGKTVTNAISKLSSHDDISITWHNNILKDNARILYKEYLNSEVFLKQEQNSTGEPDGFVWTGQSGTILVNKLSILND